MELESIGKEIVRKCNGLPLAIIVVGGLLWKQRQSEKVMKEMNSHLGTGANVVSTTLELSYHNSPPQLKSCFLCLGFFNEDATIPAKKLVQVWIAQGLIPTGGVGGETAEDIARDYLDELINLNLVQVKDTSKDDRVKTCHIHDILRELSISKAKVEISFEILNEEGTQCLNKPRHCALYNSIERFMVYSKNRNKCIHSLFFHRLVDVNASRPSYWKSFELLRVLDFETFGLQILPDTIGDLIGLRYLGLRNNYIKKLPSSIGRLINLEVLDIASNGRVKVSTVLWKINSLRHHYASGIWCKVPPKMDTLKNLQTLTYIPVATTWTPNQSAEMTSLCKLGIELEVDLDQASYVLHWLCLRI